MQANLYQAFFMAWQQADNGSLTGLYLWNGILTPQRWVRTTESISVRRVTAQSIITAGFIAATPGAMP